MTKIELPLCVVQDKQRDRNAKWIRIPILPALRKVIDGSPTGDLTFLVSERCAPYSTSRIGTAIKGWCRDAGLPHCSAHGLHKTGATIAAVNGASAFQLMSVFGWQDAQQAVGYTREMERRKMAAEAMHLLVPEEQAGNKSVPQMSSPPKCGTLLTEKHSDFKGPR
jgi:integrase